MSNGFVSEIPQRVPSQLLFLPQVDSTFSSTIVVVWLRYGKLFGEATLNTRDRADRINNLLFLPRLPYLFRLAISVVEDDEEKLLSVRKAIREALEDAHSRLYRTNGQAWRQILASLAFETRTQNFTTERGQNCFAYNNYLTNNNRIKILSIA